MTTPVLACDLDRTLIYSAAAAGADGTAALVAVERYRDADASFVTAAAAAGLAARCSSRPPPAHRSSGRGSGCPVRRRAT